MGQFSIKNLLEEALVKNGIKQQKNNNKLHPQQITAASEKNILSPVIVKQNTLYI